MKEFKLFKNVPDGFRLATKEDLPLVTLTLAQALTDCKYPIPSIEVEDNAFLKFNYEISEKCALNAIENGVVLTNEDFSAVLLITPYELRTDYCVDSLYNNLKNNADIGVADNMLNILNYVCEAEKQINIDKNTVFVDMFAVQTPKQGQKLGSKLMRELFRQCEENDMNVFLYTNTENNKDIYNHFGFKTISAVHRDDINSDTYFLLWKSLKHELKDIEDKLRFKQLYPMYYCKKENIQSQLELFKDLGFEKLHYLKDGFCNEGYVLGNDNGSKMELFTRDNMDANEGLWGMKIGVNNLDVAIDFMNNKGYKLLSEVVETKSNRCIYAKAPNGMNCCFMEHIKSKPIQIDDKLANDLWSKYGIDLEY